MMYSLILILFVSLLATGSLGQDVETRGTNGEKVTSGGQARALYKNQKMHFGKRVPRAIQQFVPLKVPFNFAIGLERGETFLEAIPDDVAGGYEFDDTSNQLRPNYQYRIVEPTQLQQQPSVPSPYSPQQPRFLVNSLVKPTEQTFSQFISRQQQQPEKFSRLLSNNNNNDAGELNGTNNNADNDNNSEQAQHTSNQAAGSMAPFGVNQQQDENINLNTRSSMQSSVNKPKSGLFMPDHYSHLFYKPQNFGTYNKKAEPKDNFFMHFGRK